MKMQMRKSHTATRAWNILRLALLSARKGGALRRRAMFNLPKYIKSLRNHHGGDTFRYGERQLSFDHTPVIHVRMHRPSSLRFKLPHIPCINPAQVDFDDTDDDGLYYDNILTKGFLKGAEDDEEEKEQVCSVSDHEIYEDEDEDEQSANNNNIDTKAEEFIAKFYAQMKMQRQISYLEYHDRSISVDS